MTFRTLTTVALSATALSACGPSFYIARGEDHLAGSRPDAAAQEFQKALDKDPSAVAALRGMAAAHLHRDQPIRAIIPAQRASKAGDLEARRILTEAFITTGRPKDALKAAEEGRADAPDDPSLRMLFVQALTAVGQFQDAADTADELLIDLDGSKARSLHAWTLSRAGRVDAAVAMAADAVALASDDGMIQAEAASIYWKGHKKADFENANKMARALLPASPRQAMQRAKWLEEQGDIEGSIRHLEALRGAYTKDGVLAGRLGLLYAKRASWQNAARHLSDALRLKPYQDDVSVSGVQVMTTGGPEKEQARRAEHTDIAEHLGIASTEIGQHGKAAQAWEVAAAQSNKPTAAMYVRIAEAWKRDGSVDGMGRASQIATELDPSDARAHYLLAQAYDGSRNIEWAVRHAQRAWALSPTSPEIAAFLGGLYEGRGESRTARDLYREALLRHPKDARLQAGFERVGGRRR